MKKKITAVILSIVLCFSMAISSFALDLSAITGALGIDEEKLTEILNSEVVQEIMSSDGVVDITAMVMQIVASVDIDGSKQGAQDLLVGVINSTIGTVSDTLKQILDNKDIAIVYDKGVIEHLFDVDLDKNKEETTKDPAETTTEKTEIKIGLGDVDMDGQLTAADARLTLRRAAKLVTLTPEQEKLADVDKDGVITAADARYILQASSQLIKIEDAAKIAASKK